MREVKLHTLRLQRLAVICGAVLLTMVAGPAAAPQSKTVKVVAATGPASQSVAGPTTIQNDEPVIVSTDLVTMTVSVTDVDGRCVSGLEKKDFSILDNKVPQEISFFSDDDQAASVGIVFDVSGSMSGSNLMKAKDALANFIQTSHPQDEYFLIDFSSSPRLLLNRTLDGEAVLRKLTLVQPGGQTALYDATYLALAHLAGANSQKRADSIISPGQDNDSRYTFSQHRRALKESDVTIYAIGTNPNANVKAEMYGRLALEELASASGGRAFFPRNATQMAEAFERVALELRHRYSIGYRPTDFIANGKWHRVKVTVKTPAELKRVFVRSSDGYYASASWR